MKPIETAAALFLKERRTVQEGAVGMLEAHLLKLFEAVPLQGKRLLAGPHAFDIARVTCLHRRLGMTTEAQSTTEALYGAKAASILSGVQTQNTAHLPPYTGYESARPCELER